MRLLFLLLTFITLTPAQAKQQEAKPLHITISKQQQSLAIPLAANPTTGYNWSVISFDSNLLELMNSEYQKPTTNRMGAGGKMVFTFTLKPQKAYPKSSTLIFKYARPWDPQQGTLQQVFLLVND